MMPADSKQTASGSARSDAQLQPAVVAEKTAEGTAKSGPVSGNDVAAANSRINLSLLDQRLNETEKWLQQVADDHYSIQLFMTQIADANALEQFLRDPSDLLDFEKIYVYETRIGGSRMYSVLYNDFNSRKTARSILQNLPAEMRASKPFLRRVSALRKDLESSG
jgi:septal ring-binding cell division protein DamX